MKSYQQRYFVLEGHYIRYYHKKPEDSAAEEGTQGVYNVSDVERVERSGEDDKIFFLEMLLHTAAI